MKGNREPERARVRDRASESEIPVSSASWPCLTFVWLEQLALVCSPSWALSSVKAEALLVSCGLFTKGKALCCNTSSPPQGSPLLPKSNEAS